MTTEKINKPPLAPPVLIEEPDDLSLLPISTPPEAQHPPIAHQNSSYSVVTTLPQEVVKFRVTGEEVVQYDNSQYLAYLHKSKTTFQKHLGHVLNKQKGLSLDDYMLHLSRQPECSTRPIFMSMARVSSDLYWQLIENFFYTMYYFDNLVSITDLT